MESQLTTSLALWLLLNPAVFCAFKNYFALFLYPFECPEYKILVFLNWENGILLIFINIGSLQILKTVRNRGESHSLH